MTQRTGFGIHRAVSVVLCLAGAAPLRAAPPNGIGLVDDEDAAVLRLKSGTIALDSQSSLHRAAGANRRPVDNGGPYVVQLDGPLTPERTAILAAAGVRLGAYLPNYSYIVRVPAGHDLAARLENVSFVRWVGPFRSAWKLDPAIGREPLKSAERLALAQDNKLQLLAVLFEGEDADRAAERIRAIPAARVVGVQHAGDAARIVVTIPNDRYARLADDPGVQWVEEVAEAEPRNYSSNWIAQSNAADVFSVWNRGLTGAGQVGGLIDGNYAGTEGLNASHCSFRDPGGNPIGPAHRKLIAYFGPSDYDLHATHTSGTMVGDEQPIAGTTANRGMAYAAKLAFTNIRQLNPSYDNLSLYAMLTQDAGAGARVHSNSWGSGGTNYNIWCQDIDKFSYNDEDQLVCFAVINSGVVAKPENAKNVLAVAAHGDAPNQNNYCYGGAGPTEDGRRKPEIMATGCSVVSSSGAGATCGFAPNSGTSMACPLVAGAGLLVRQYFMEGFYPSGAANPADAFTPSGALLRAMLLNGTRDVTGIADYPSDLEGWGRLLLENALYFTGDSRKLAVAEDLRNANGLTTGQVRAYAGVVNGGSESLRVTLVWTEKEAALNANPAYINNLDLEVRTSGAIYRGNVFAGGQSATGGTADTKNNVEQVLRNAPTTGLFRIVVRATAVNTVAPQGFALVATGNITPTVACKPGDVNGDGLVNGEDAQPFVGVLLSGTGTLGQLCGADVNLDAVVNTLDLTALVQCLTGAGPCPP
jgi:hypothetical protein